MELLRKSDDFRVEFIIQKIFQLKQKLMLTQENEPDIKPISLVEIFKEEFQQSILSVANCHPFLYVVTGLKTNQRNKTPCVPISAPFDLLLHVYEYQKTFRDMKLKDSIRLDGLTSVSKMLALQDCVFLMSCVDNCLWRMPLNTLKPTKALQFAEITTVWSVEEGSRGQLLILTTHFGIPQLIVCCSEHPEKYLQTVTLSSIIRDPLYAAQKPSGNIIIYHRSNKGAICEWNMTKDVVVKNRNIKEKICPVGVFFAFDRYGRILTRRLRKDKLVVLDPDFNQYCKTSIPENLCTPDMQFLRLGSCDSRNQEVVLYNRRALYGFALVE